MHNYNYNSSRTSADLAGLCVSDSVQIHCPSVCEVVEHIPRLHSRLSCASQVMASLHSYMTTPLADNIHNKD